MRWARIQVVNQWLTAIQSVAIIGGIAVAIWQLLEISAQTRLQAQTLIQSQKAASATLVLQLRDKLDGDRYKKITDAIQNNTFDYPLIARIHQGKGGKFRDNDVDAYISIFEDIAYLVRDDVILSKMAYDHFSMDIEYAWCNADVQRLIKENRKADKSITANSDPVYGSFEKLALEYLKKEGQSCKDLD
jgi:hypothetical protein